MTRVRVYIIGSKGIPASYGGFETFVDNLISKRKADIDYVVTGMGTQDSIYEYKGAKCIQFKTGPSALARILHTVRALAWVFKDAYRNSSPKKVLYILGCRAGIFLPFFRPLLKMSKVTILANPDGAEWKRAKWNFIAKQIVILYEALLIRFSDIIVCDAMAMLELIHKDFKVPKSKITFIAYGSEVYNEPRRINSYLQERYDHWLKDHEVKNQGYYLIVGRFVPENNFDLIIKEFMASKTRSDLVIISNVEDNSFYNKLIESTGLKNDPRIKFVGTVYDQDLLKVIRARARAYLHGHEVGGTNPSLLEALGSTNVNLAYDVSFNREVAGAAALYFGRRGGDLASLVNKVDEMPAEQNHEFGLLAKRRISKDYNWRKIVNQYEELFEK